MAKTKTADYRGMSDEQLALTLTETEKHLFQLRFQSATDRLETPSEIRKAKKDIARLLTIQRERSLAKLKAAPDSQIAAKLVELEAREEGPGKRAVRRHIRRLQGIQAARATPAKRAK